MASDLFKRITKSKMVSKMVSDLFILINSTNNHSGFSRNTVISGNLRSYFTILLILNIL